MEIIREVRISFFYNCLSIFQQVTAVNFDSWKKFALFDSSLGKTRRENTSSSFKFHSILYFFVRRNRADLQLSLTSILLPIFLCRIFNLRYFYQRCRRRATYTGFSILVHNIISKVQI